MNIDVELKINETYASKDYCSMLKYTGRKGDGYCFDEFEYNDQTEEFDRFTFERVLTRREVLNQVII